MNTQPPEQNPNDYDEVTRLRLQLHHAETQRDAFAAGLKTDVLKIAKVAIYQASIDAGKAADADAMGCMAVELDDVKAENARLKTEVERLDTGIQPAGSNDAVGRAVNVLLEKEKEIARLKAEVESLESDLKLEKENEDRLVRNWQHANNEVHGLRSQIAALIDNQTSLKAEVERLRSLSTNSEQRDLKADVARLKNNCDYLDRKLDEEIDKSAMLCGQIEKLRKLGTEMGKYLPDTDEANRAYIDFEAGGRS